MTPRIKVANWNISVANWLREAFYQRFQNINIKNSKATLLTVFVSAFWHGINPSYYLGFLIVNISIQTERLIFRNPKIRFFPRVLYIFIFDYGHCLFKSYLISKTVNFIRNTKEILIFIFALYFIIKYYPKERQLKKE